METSPKKKVIKQANPFDNFLDNLETVTDPSEMERLIDILRKARFPDVRKQQIITEMNEKRQVRGLPLLKLCQLKDLKEPKELTPYKLPGEPDPSKAESVCLFCGSQTSPLETVCPNCGRSNFEVGQPCQRKPDEKGKQFNPHSNPTGVVVQKGVPLQRSAQAMPDMGMGAPPPPPPTPPKKLRRHKDRADKDEGTASETHKTDEISQCVDPFERSNENADKNKRDRIMEITKSCDDLAIDG